MMYSSLILIITIFGALEYAPVQSNAYAKTWQLIYIEREVEIPEKLRLNLHVYFDPAWRGFHKAIYVEEAFKVVEEANEILQHPDLKTKIELSVSKERIFNSTKRHRTLARNVKKVQRLLKPPFQVPGKKNHQELFSTAHVYLTIGGIVEERTIPNSICSEDNPALSIVRWSYGGLKSTARTLAIGVADMIGMHQSKDEDRSDCFQRLVDEKGKNIHEWAKCCNDDFKKTILSQKGRFCLETI